MIGGCGILRVDIQFGEFEFEFEFVDDCIESSGVPRVGSTRPLVG